MDIVAQPAGREQAMIEKRLAEDRVFTIDCSELLREYELIVKSLSADGPGLTLSNAWSRAGRVIELNIGGGQVPSTLPFKDFQASVNVLTTQGTLRVAFTVRVYKF